MKRNLSRHQKWISIHASYANNATPCVSSVAARTSFQSTHRTQTMRPGLDTTSWFAAWFQSTHRTQTMRQFLLGFFALCGHISIHASYANDATIKSQNLIKTKKNFNPRIVRKRCDAFDNADDLTRYISIHASYANDATLLTRSNHSSALYFNPRIVRKRCDKGHGGNTGA